MIPIASTYPKIPDKYMLKGLFFVISLFLCFISAFSQDANTTSDFISRKGDNWFVGAGAGISAYFGGENRYIPKSQGGYLKMVTWPAGGVWGGRWISPSVAIKGEFDVGSSRSWNAGDSYDLIHNGQPYFTKFDHVELSMDMLFNLHNLFLGVNDRRRFFILFYLGPGIARTFNDFKVPPDTHMVFKSGGMLFYKISHALGFYGDLQGTIVPQKFSGEHFFRSYEGFLTPMVGIQYTFPGKTRGFESCCSCTVSDQNYLLDRVNELQQRVFALQKDSTDKAAALANCEVTPTSIDTCKQVSKIMTIIKGVLAQQPKEDLYVPIHFTIDKWNIRDQERYKLNEIALFMRHHPDDTICIGGYADVKTAYPAYNMMLGIKRAQKVINTLVTEYGINPHRFIWKSFGDGVQPFSINALNRAVIAYNIHSSSNKSTSVYYKNYNGDNNVLSVTGPNNKLNVAIHFIIDKWYIRPSQRYKLDQIALYIKNNPRDTVFVGGYADVKTAYPAYNKRLGVKRANEVITTMVNTYHIARNRFSWYSFGDSVQPFKINALNRAAIAMNRRNMANKIAPDLPDMPNRIPERTDSIPTDTCQKIMIEWNNLLNQIKHPQKERLYIDIHYPIDQWHMPQKEMYKLDDIVRFMIQYPDVHISVTGYADVQTAYPAYNLKLGEERANEVIRVLTILYGMDADRISGKSLGDTVQPFRVNDSNRVVIAIDVEE